MLMFSQSQKFILPINGDLLPLLTYDSKFQITHNYGTSLDVLPNSVSNLPPP